MTLQAISPAPTPWQFYRCRICGELDATLTDCDDGWAYYHVACVAPASDRSPQCDHWPCLTRCRERGTLVLYGPDGRQVPGGPLCPAHAEAVLIEYRDTLGERWRVEAAR